jgi:riboflavin kinase/FMN adenylyltransferase
MRVFRSVSEVPDDARNCAISIGNFDGVHEGHKSLLRRNRELCRENGWISSVLTFDPHPTTIVAPERAPHLLTTMEQRLALIAAEGIEQAFVLRFDLNFSHLEPDEFVREVLARGLGAKAVLVGDSFRFGSHHAGNVQTLRTLGEECGFCTEVAPLVVIRGRMVSSTAVRELVNTGDVSAACRMLGRPYALEGEVVGGFGIGSKQTVPTLNLDTKSEVLPASGVYITRTRDLGDGREWPSVTNVGFRPTFNGDRLTIETFLLATLEGPTPQRIRVEFLRRVREERRFDSPESLKKQIMVDVGRAKAYFRRLGAFRTLRARDNLKN